MPVLHTFVNPIADEPGFLGTKPSDWNDGHSVDIVDADVNVAAGIVESKLALNFPTHAEVTLGTASGLSLVGQVLSLGLASSGVTGALSGTDWDTFNNKQSTLTFPLASNLGGTGIANGAGSTLTLGAATSITGGGTIALGGFTLTVPATGTAALLATANVFTANQKINVNSTAALLVEQDGVNDDTLVVDTTNQRVFIGGSAGGKLTYPGMALYRATGGNIGIVIQASGNDTRGLLDLYGKTFGGVETRFSLNPGGGDAYFSASGSNSFRIVHAARISLYNVTEHTGIVIYGDRVGINNLSPTIKLHVVETTTTTNAVKDTFRLETQVSTASTGSAAGFGVGQSFYAETATNATIQQQGLISTSWIDATNVSRKAKMSLSAYDTAARLGIEIEASGTEAKLGFYGVTTIARAVLATGVSATVDDVITALQNLGLVKQS